MSPDLPALPIHSPRPWLVGIAACALALALASASATAQVDWRALRLPGATQALAYFPGVPELRHDTIVTAVDTVHVVRYYHNDPEGLSGNRLYTLTVFTYPAGAIPADSAGLRAALFEESVLATAETVGGAVVFSEALDAGAYPGWASRVNYGTGQGASVYGRASFVGDRYYQLQVYALGPDEGLRSRERFFDTFAPVPD